MTLKPHHFPAIKEAVVAPSSLKSPPEPPEDFDEYGQYDSDEDNDSDKISHEHQIWIDKMAEARSIGGIVQALKQTGLLTSPITVTIPISDTMDREEFMALFFCLFRSPRASPKSYHFIDFLLEGGHDYVCNLLSWIFILRGVVHLKDNAPPLRASPIKLLADCLATYFSVPRRPEGRLFLVGLPPLALSPSELSAVNSNDANELAAIKLFDIISFSRRFVGWSRAQKWAYYTSRVRLVDGDFRPTLKDLTEVLVPGPEGRESVVAPCV